MAPTDYNKKKNLEVTSQNDSGTTQDKAQPIILQGKTTNKDGFEDGDYTSNPPWTVEDTSGGTLNVVSTESKNGSNSLLFETQSTDTNEDIKLSNSFDNSNLQTGDEFQAWVKIKDNLDPINVLKLTSSSGGTAKLTIESGDILYKGDSINFQLLTSVSLDTWYKLVIRYNGNSIDFEFRDSNDDLIADAQNVDAASSYDFDQVTFLSRNSDSSFHRAYWDGVSYLPSSGDTEAKTGTGDIVVDFSNIAGPEDIAVYDQNGNLLDYEIENLDTTAETATLWCYNSWTRDDTVQAQVAYGSNSANTDRQNVTGTWGNTGQNTLLVQHLNGDATDSTSNNNDGSVTGTTTVSGQFADALEGDGNDDLVKISPIDLPVDSPITYEGWIYISSNNTDGPVIFDTENSRNLVFLQDDDDDGIYNDVGYNNPNKSPENIAKDVPLDEFFHFVVVFDHTSSNTADITTYVNGSQNLQKTSVTTNFGTGLDSYFIGNDVNSYYLEGKEDELKVYKRTLSSDSVQASYDASPKAGQVYFSQQAAETTTTTTTLTTITSTANASGETLNLTGSTTAATTTANATATGQTIFIEPDFATLDAAANATGGSISISGSTTVDVQTPAAATATGDDTLKITSNIFVGQAASASASGSAIKTDRLSGTVDVDDQPTGGVDINVVDKTNNILYETTTDSNGDWIVDSGDGILYQVAYLFDDGTTYYGDAEESDTT